MPVMSHIHIPQLPDILSRSEPVIKLPESVASTSTTSFSLDFSGVAGFFGGDGAVCAMATVHLLPFRSWGGWYNSPGSYEIAKKYGQIANSPFWDGLFPGSKVEPAELFELNGKVGQAGRFLGVHSGTSLPPGHAAYLLSRMVKDMEPTVRTSLASGVTYTSDVYVTIVDLRRSPSLADTKTDPASGQESLPANTPFFIDNEQSKTANISPAPTNNDSNVFLPATPDTIARLPLRYSGFLAIIPIVASITTCVICGLVGDWWCCSSIALGIVAGGVACLIIGSGKLVLRRAQSTPLAPEGDGLMWEGTEVIVLLGDENKVNVFTRGSFSLDFGPGVEHRAVGWCSFLLTLQFLVQLLLIPQGQLLGQIMFITSLAVSWVYNMYVSSFDKERLQMNLLLQWLMPELEPGGNREDFFKKRVRRYQLPSWRTAVVFSLLELQRNKPVSDPRKPLDELLPNDTPVWRKWKEEVTRLLRKSGGQKSGEDDNPRGEDEDPLYDLMLKDAELVHDGWKNLKDTAHILPSPPSPISPNLNGLPSTSSSPPLVIATVPASAADTAL